MNKKSMLALSLALVMLLAFGCAAPAANNEPTPAVETPAPVAQGLYIPGTYTGTGAGRNGDITVSVTFDADVIMNVEVTNHTETEGIGTSAIDKLPGFIIEQQTLAVADAVSGATMTGTGIVAAVADAVEQAGGDVAALKDAEYSVIAGDLVAKTVDVVVVGGGGAGIAAAASAAENGASVVLIEKTAALGGNTLASGLAMNAADPELQGSMDVITGQVSALEAVLDYDGATFGPYAQTLEVLKGQIKEYLAGDKTKIFDSVEWHTIQTYMAGLRTTLDGETVYGDFDLVSQLCEKSLETYHWLNTVVGVELSDTITSPVGSLWYRGHNFASKQGVFDAASAYITGNGGEIMTDTKAEHLIMDGAKVVGVTAMRNNGTPVTVNAKSVIITTGGFGANGDMIKEYNNYWPSIPDGIMTTCVSSVTGDGIGLGLEAGAQLKDMGLTQLMPTASALTGQLVDGLLVPSQYYMFVNQEGERFVNEYAERDTLAFAAMGQTGGTFYHIADQEMCPLVQNGASQEQIDAMVEKGIMYKADTLDELAALVGCPADALKDSVAKYNSYVDAGKDPDFGKTVFGSKIETAPFYAVIEKPAVHHTMGGLAINSAAQVLNEAGAPIEGLFAAGEVTGGLHAGNRVGGNAIADIMVYGRIAGANAAK